MTDEEVEFAVMILAPDADRQELEQLTHELARDLREQETESVRRVQDDDAIEGAKVGDPFTLGALVLVVAPIVITKVFDFLQSWAARHEGQTVRVRRGDIEIEFTPKKQLSAEELVSVAERLGETAPPKDETAPPKE